MKKGFRDLIDDVKYEDLVKLRKDLENGGSHTRTLVKQKLADIEHNDMKLCATCGIKINPYYIDEFILKFGRRDFKKRGSFCGKDCLNHFLSKL